jgi:hypothetical protein
MTVSLKAAVGIEGGVFGKPLRKYEKVTDMSAVKSKLQGPGGSSLVPRHEEFQKS